MTKMLNTVLTVCFVFSTFSFCAAEEIPWMTDIQAAMEQGQKENKPILLHFYGDFCGPCKAMDKMVFPDPSVVNELTTNFIPVKIDTSRDQATTQKYGIRGIPADVFVTSQGEILHQRVGGSDARKYLQEVQNVAKIAHSKLNITTQDSTIQHVASQQSTQDDRTQFVNEIETQSKPSPPQNHALKMGGGLPLKTTTVARRPITNMSHESNMVPTEQESEPTQKVAQNSNLPEKNLLFDGYCPVTLSMETRWVKGQERYFAEYEGGLFYFASEEARSMFLEAPYQYAPVASGNDIVEWAVNQKKVLGSRNFGAWFQGNVYLFTNRDNYERFQANPHFFAGQALQMSRLFSHQLR